MSDTSPDPEREITELLFRVTGRLLHRNDPTSPLNEMPVSQLRCLGMIARSEGEKMVDLARKLEIKLPALSQIVDRLVKRGMLERQVDPDDRRIVRLELTAEAKWILAAASEKRHAGVRTAIAHLNAVQIEQITGALQMLVAAGEHACADRHGHAAEWPAQKVSALEDLITQDAGTDRDGAPGE